MQWRDLSDATGQQTLTDSRDLSQQQSKQRQQFADGPSPYTTSRLFVHSRSTDLQAARHSTLLFLLVALNSFSFSFSSWVFTISSFLFFSLRFLPSSQRAKCRRPLLPNLSLLSFFYRLLSFFFCYLLSLFLVIFLTFRVILWYSTITLSGVSSYMVLPIAFPYTCMFLPLFPPAKSLLLHVFSHSSFSSAPILLYLCPLPKFIVCLWFPVCRRIWCFFLQRLYFRRKIALSPDCALGTMLLI